MFLLVLSTVLVVFSRLVFAVARLVRLCRLVLVLILVLVSVFHCRSPLVLPLVRGIGLRYDYLHFLFFIYR